MILRNRLVSRHHTAQQNITLKPLHMLSKPATELPHPASEGILHTASSSWTRLRTHSLFPAWLKYPLLAFMVSRLLVFGAGMMADAVFPTDPGHWVADANSTFLSMWAKWDSQYYVDIATDGYWFVPGAQSNVAFFPLYPLLMRVLAPFLGHNLILAGFVISNVAFLGALIFLYLLAELEVDSAAARRAIFYLALFPTAFFFSAVYTESLFLLLTIATMYFARKRLWLIAALAGMLAAATRNLGVVMWVLVMWEWLRAQGWRIRSVTAPQSWRGLRSGLWMRWIEIAIIALIPLGLLLYMYFLNQNFERPLAFFETQSAFGRENIGPIAVIRRSLGNLVGMPFGRGWLTNFWNLAALLGFLGLVPFIWRRLGGGYALIVLICLLVPATSAMGSIIRYVLPLYPVFILLGAWGRREWLDRALISTFAMSLGLFTAIFVNWIFVA